MYNLPHCLIDICLVYLDLFFLFLKYLRTKIDKLLDTNEVTINNSVKYLEETLVQTKRLMKNIDRMMIDLDNAVLRKGNNFEEIMENLNRTANNLEEFSKTIKEQPWSIIRKSAPKERKFE